MGAKNLSARRDRGKVTPLPAIPTTATTVPPGHRPNTSKSPPAGQVGGRPWCARRTLQKPRHRKDIGPRFRMRPARHRTTIKSLKNKWLAVGCAVRTIFLPQTLPPHRWPGQPHRTNRRSAGTPVSDGIEGTIKNDRAICFAGTARSYRTALVITAVIACTVRPISASPRPGCTRNIRLVSPNSRATGSRSAGRQPVLSKAFSR